MSKMVEVNRLLHSFKMLGAILLFEQYSDEDIARYEIIRDFRDFVNTYIAWLENGAEDGIVDAVPREEYNLLVRRFEHLLESDYIRSFDGVELSTGKYKRDIREADREHPHGRWVKAHGMMPPEYHHRHVCSVCGGWALQDFYGRERFSLFCPHCGAKMDGGAE